MTIIAAICSPTNINDRDFDRRERSFVNTDPGCVSILNEPLGESLKFRNEVILCKVYCMKIAWQMLFRQIMNNLQLSKLQNRSERFIFVVVGIATTKPIIAVIDPFMRSIQIFNLLIGLKLVRNKMNALIIEASSNQKKFIYYNAIIQCSPDRAIAPNRNQHLLFWVSRPLLCFYFSERGLSPTHFSSNSPNPERAVPSSDPGYIIFLVTGPIFQALLCEMPTYWARKSEVTLFQKLWI